jgi:DNA-directed RNA polymerase subunit N (RpoN/RPB10)
MAFTLQQLADLDESIAEGSLEVEYEDKRVKYRSLEDMLRIRALMAEQLGVTSKCGRRRLISYSKGLDK